MDGIEDKIHRLSQLQLKILLLFTKSDNGIIFHPEKINGKTGKALGAIFSSLSRRNIGTGHLILPWGRDEKGKLRWKLNTDIISKVRLEKILKELLGK